MTHLSDAELQRMRKQELVALVTWLQAPVVREVRQLLADLSKGETDGHDHALGALAISLATQIEACEAKELPALARELRAVLAELREKDRTDADADGFWSIVSAPLGHTEND